MRTRRTSRRYEAPLTRAEIAAAAALCPQATTAFLADPRSVRRLLASAR